MSLKGRLRKCVFCTILAAASMGGVLMSPEEIEQLMFAMNRPKIVRTVPEERETDDDLLKRMPTL